MNSLNERVVGESTGTMTGSDFMDDRFEHSDTTCAGCVLDKPDREHCEKCREYYKALPKILNLSYPVIAFMMLRDSSW